jgi:transposase
VPPGGSGPQQTDQSSSEKAGQRAVFEQEYDGQAVNQGGQPASDDPDLTLDEHCELFEEAHSVRVSNATMSRAFKRLRLPLKKSRSQPQSATKSGGRFGEKRRGR